MFVETLDKSFENVCELDLIFHSDKVSGYLHMVGFMLFQVHYILDEIVMGGMVLETSLQDIISAVTDMERLASQKPADASKTNVRKK